MKSTFKTLILLFFLITQFSFGQDAYQLIENVNRYINQDSVTYYIQSLQNFRTRFEYNDNRKEIANWLKNEFLSMGYEQVELDSFVCQTGFTDYGDAGAAMQYNVVATLPGTERPDEIYIIGGHYDSYSNTSDPMVEAPGADDNASGTTAALETARAIKLAGYQPEATIKFVCFAAEELMLSGNSGSEYMAAKYREQNVNLKLMINNDMIANNPRPLEESMVSVNYYTGYENLKDMAITLMDHFSVVKPMEGDRDVWTDSKSFFIQGFPAVYYDEYDFSPNYHSTNDVISNCDLEYCTEVIKGSAAMLIYSIEAPAMVRNLTAFDAGDGSTIELVWLPNTESDFDHYEIYYGTSENELSLVEETSDTTYTFSDLTEGTEYFFSVKAVDAEGNEGLESQTSAVPFSLPLAAENVSADPKWHQIQISWQEKFQLDLAGVNIYKREFSNDEFSLIDQLSLEDTVFIDDNVESGTWYEYIVKPYDDENNESINNTIVKSRAVTLDRGVLFVNETSDGDGSFGSPTYQQVEDFYSSLLGNNYEQYSVNTLEEPGFNLANLGAHQTVVWHVENSDDLTSSDYNDIIKEYLDYGGNILYAGYKPSYTFANATNVVNEFLPGTFIYEYLKIDTSQTSIFALFKFAESNLQGYPNLELDPAKIESADGHIKKIESIFPNENGVQIYTYRSDYEDGTLQGALNGKSIGVQYMSEDYNSVIISLPLYYVKQQQASDFLSYVLQNVFETPTGIEEDNTEELLNDYSLSQNYPNPFNPSTSIEYQVASIEKVSLKVYDVLGREIKTLVNEIKSPGTYKITFDASELSSGIYFYRLTSGSFTQTRKMILMK